MLTATGLFGVIAYAVSERTHEIGIRMALGAGPREVFRLVVGRGMLLASIGFLVGFPLAVGAGRLVAGLLYGVSPDDFPTFPGVGGMRACWRGWGVLSTRAARHPPGSDGRFKKRIGVVDHRRSRVGHGTLPPDLPLRCFRTRDR